VNNTIVLPKSERPGTARINALDIARGIAILGTLWTNIWIFTHPWGMLGYLAEPNTADTTDAAATAQLWIMALSQGKFLALLTLLFGMGLAIQHSSAARRGARWPGPYLWRMTLLLLDGTINYILIAEFDVLMGYAVTGGIVAWLILTRPRTQRVMIWIFGALHLLLISAIALLVASLPADNTGSGLTGASPYATESFLGLALFRLNNAVVFRAEPVLIAFLSIAMFLIGVRLHRAGVFRAEGAALRRRLMVVGAIALPIDLVLGVWGGTPGLLVERYLVAPFVALGLLGLIGEVCLRRGTNGWWSRRFREVGRTALSCYLLQNLLAGALFYGWGLGLAAHLGQWRVPLTMVGYAVVASLVVLCAHLWLRRFTYGPVEWVWRLGTALVPDKPAEGSPATTKSRTLGDTTT
jgi:uncharacterized protein